MDLAAAGSSGCSSAFCQAVAAEDLQAGGRAVALAGIVAARQAEAALEALAAVEILEAAALGEAGNPVSVPGAFSPLPLGEVG